MIWLWLSAATMVATAITHSMLGERRLIGPLLDANIELLAGYRARLVRFAWHFTSVLMVLTALLVVWPGTPSMLILMTGIAWLVAGISDGLLTHWRHVGWGPLSIAGVLAVVGALT